ncbi:hypothetical protein [Yinghuangia seranimata]|uniref:hypothetical protein n=1 Tax=Yinghuangia seranimata TaxID=408067 RepID=UPI00248C0BD0|nr:hypothetical protein [Yinghuangia seranimata]MDI2130980.1 hypothetical protein [Yinghuangia seranimata]
MGLGETAMAVAGGLLRRTYETGATVAERTARRAEPWGARAAEWIPGVLLVVVAATSALILLRTGASLGGPSAAAAPDATGYAPPAPADGGGGLLHGWTIWDLTAVLLPWSIPLVIGGVGLTDTAYVHRRGAVAGVLLVGLGGAALTSLFDLIGHSGDPTDPPRWLGVIYLLRFGFAVQILVGVVLWIHLAPPRHRTALNAALAATLAAALPLLFAIVGVDLLDPLWQGDAVWQTALPLVAFVLVLLLLPTGRVLVRPGQGWPVASRGAFRSVVLLGLVGAAVAVWALVDQEDVPKAISLWPVVALAGCLVAAALTYRVDGVRSVAGALLAMAVGLAAVPAALFGFDRTSFNPGLGFDGPSESVPWIAGLLVAGVAGAVLARVLGAWSIGLAALVLVVGEAAGPDSGSTHVLLVRCAGALALGVVIGGLRPEPALASLGLTATCGPVWPDLQSAAQDYGWVEKLTERPGGVPVPLLILAGLAIPLSVWAGLRQPRSGPNPDPAAVGAWPHGPAPVPAQASAAAPFPTGPDPYGPGPYPQGAAPGANPGPDPYAAGAAGYPPPPPADNRNFGGFGLGPGPRRGDLGNNPQGPDERP